MVSKPLLRFLSSGKLSVFLFHKVPADPDPLVPGELDLATFRRTVEFIAEHFNVIPLSDAVHMLGNGAIGTGTACITFDDGYADWMHGAVALLEELGLPATFFITSCQFDGMPMWHERIAYAIRSAQAESLEIPGFGLPRLDIASSQEKSKAIALVENYLKYQELHVRDELLAMLEAQTDVSYSKLPRLTEEQLRDMHSRGFEIGAHTLNHPILSMCDPDEAMREIGAVREVLSGIVRGDIRSFAYPNGRPKLDFNADHIRMVQKAGYTHAVTTQWGAANSRTSPFEIPRFTPWGPGTREMVLQVARNLLTKPRLILLPGRAASEEARVSSALVKVLSVENGAGFGGAIIALQTLLSHFEPGKIESHVVTNFNVGNFGELSCVRSHDVVSDRVRDFRAMSRRVANAYPGKLGSALLFGIGRLDDLVNRAPYFFRLIVLTMRIDPDIIHGNNEPNSNREAMLVAKLLRKPYVQHLRGPLGPSRHTPWLLATPDVFIPVSRWMAGELALAGVRGERIRQIYDAVDLGPLRTAAGNRTLREEYEIDNQTIIIAMIGMLVPWKGQHLFLDAVEQLCESGIARVRFLIIGDTPARGNQDFAAQLKQHVEKSGLGERVIFTGRRNDLPAILPEIDVVVSASIDPEPLGLVMLEALASGCLFVGPSHGAVPEVVEKRASGFTFFPNSSRSLASTLAQVIKVRELNGRVTSKELMQEIEAKYSGTTCAFRTVQVLTQM